MNIKIKDIALNLELKSTPWGLRYKSFPHFIIVTYYTKWKSKNVLSINIFNKSGKLKTVSGITLGKEYSFPLLTQSGVYIMEKTFIPRIINFYNGKHKTINVNENVIDISTESMRNILEEEKIIS